MSTDSRRIAQTAFVHVAPIDGASAVRLEAEGRNSSGQMVKVSIDLDWNICAMQVLDGLFAAWQVEKAKRLAEIQHVDQMAEQRKAS